MHFRRWQRHGDPLVKLRRYQRGIEARLDLYIEKTDGCWLWTGHMQNAGYGFISIKGKQYLVHRFMYERYNGAIPEGLVLDHLCRVTTCVNPDHLEPVTTAENVRRGVASRMALR